VAEAIRGYRGLLFRALSSRNPLQKVTEITKEIEDEDETRRVWSGSEVPPSLRAMEDVGGALGVPTRDSVTSQ